MKRLIAGLLLALLIASPVAAAKPAQAFITADAATYAVGDTITFATSEGVIDFRCVDEDGTVLLGGGLFRGDFDFVVSYSPAWAADPVSLDCTASLVDLIHGRIRTLASTEFALTP